MPRAKQNPATDADWRTVSELCDDLQTIATKKVRGADAKTIELGIDKLWSLAQVDEDLQALAKKLFALEDEYEADARNFPEQLPKTDLAVSVGALTEVLEFLSRRAPSRCLLVLRNALLDIVAGASPADMFHPEDHPRGRRPEALSVLQAQGMLAGIMHVQQSAGMSRQDAAAWVARHVSPKLAARISGKPLTARVIEEWLDRFGGEFGEDGVAREHFLLWKEHYGPTPERFREITDSFAGRLPGRKPR